MQLLAMMGNIIEPINLDLRKMNAIVIVGPNGIGKSTFIKSIVEDSFYQGEKRFALMLRLVTDQTQQADTK